MWSWTDNGFTLCDSVPLSDRGFRYGMSVFESLRLAPAGPQYVAEHLARLLAACEARHFPVAPEALAAAGALLEGWERPAFDAEGFARIYVTAGDGVATAPVERCRVFVFIEPRSRALPEAYQIAISDELFHPPFGGLKTGNYWINLDVLQRAQAIGKEEALLFNERAELVSGCVANVFVVTGNSIRTPSTYCGARPGVIREQIMKRFAVEECSLFVQDVMNADEVFLANSWIGVKPVATMHDRVFFSRVISAQLADL